MRSTDRAEILRVLTVRAVQSRESGGIRRSNTEIPRVEAVSAVHTNGEYSQYVLPNYCQYSKGKYPLHSRISESKGHLPTGILMDWILLGLLIVSRSPNPISIAMGRPVRGCCRL